MVHRDLFAPFWKHDYHDTWSQENLMSKKLCLTVALVLTLTSISCSKISARIEIKQANEAYSQEKYATALTHYEAARAIDPSFPDVDRLIGYSNLGMFKPGDDSVENQKVADRAVLELRKYLVKRPNDAVAREALINLYLNADRTSEAIEFFREYLKANPADLNAVKSIANLYAKTGDFTESLNWYEKITLLDSNSPEAFYVYGVVCYEKVAKNPPEDPAEKMLIIQKGRAALDRAITLREDYFEALVYQNLLYREEAKGEVDPEKQAELMAQADSYRTRAVEVSRARKKAS